MTPEEQKVFDAMKAENEQLKKNQAQQNRYITQLEAQRGAAPQANPQAAPAAPQGGTFTMPAGQAKIYQNFIEEQMREKTMDKAIAFIKSQVAADVYAAVEPDFLEFLKNNMTVQTCTQEFIVDAFNLAFGRAKMNKDHAVNKLGKSVETPPATPAPTQPVGTNAQQVQQVQRVLSSQPPVMSDKDGNAAQGEPQPAGQPGVKSTKDAWANLKSRFSGMGGNNFQ